MTHVVDKDVQRFLVGLADQFSGVVLVLRLVNPTLEVVLERLLSPWALGGVRDRCEGRRRTVLLPPAQHGVEVERQRAVPAHGVAEDGLAGEVLFNRERVSIFLLTRKGGKGETSVQRDRVMDYKRSEN